MKTIHDVLPLVTFVMLTAVVVALLVAAVTGLLSHIDGATPSRAALRAGAAFGSSLLVVASFLTVFTNVIK